jgi:hypothetical protein
MAIFGGRECPYVLAGDLVLLALAIAFPARHRLRCGYRDFEISLLAAAWLVPLVARYRRRHRHTLRPYRAARAAWIHLAGAALDHAVANQTQRVAQA